MAVSTATELAISRPEGHVHRQLPPAREGARENEEGEVGGDDEKDEENGAEQEEERRAHRCHERLAKPFDPGVESGVEPGRVRTERSLQSGELVLRRGGVHSGPQAPEEREDAKVRVGHAPIERLRDPDVGTRASQVVVVERLRRHAADLVHLPVEVHEASESVGGRAPFPPPQPMAHDDAILVEREARPQLPAHAQELEVVLRHEAALDAEGTPFSFPDGGKDRRCRDAFEGLRPPPRLHLPPGGPIELSFAFVERERPNDAVRVRIGERAEEHRLHQSGHGDGRSDTEREKEDDEPGVAGGPPDPAKGESSVRQDPDGERIPSASVGRDGNHGREAAVRAAPLQRAGGFLVAQKPQGVPERGEGELVNREPSPGESGLALPLPPPLRAVAARDEPRSESDRPPSSPRRLAHRHLRPFQGQHPGEGPEEAESLQSFGERFAAELGDLVVLARGTTFLVSERGGLPARA